MRPRAAVTYHRVSTLDQDPALARSELAGAAAARSVPVVRAIEETGSGARNDRPGLQEVLRLAGRAGVTDVLVWKLDRFGRSAIDVLANVRHLVMCGVTVHFTSQGFSVGPDSGAMGNLITTVLAAVAEFEREIIRERTRLGLAKARSAGKRFGRPPVTDPAKMSRATRYRRLKKGAIMAPGQPTKIKGV